MSEFSFILQAGQSKRLLTGGTYCPEDIVISAEEATEIPAYDGDVAVTLQPGESVELATAGKYCEENILVTAEEAEGSVTEQDHTVEDALVTGMLTGEYYNDRVTSIQNYVFSWRSASLSVNFPNVQGLPGYGFYQNTGLKSAKFPGAGWFRSGNTFAYCTALEHLDLGSVHTLLTNACQNAASLTSIVLRRTSAITALQSTAAFTGTPFDNGGTGGKVYVPSALIESYIADANWGVIYGYGTVEFVALEGSEYE